MPLVCLLVALAGNCTVQTAAPHFPTNEELRHIRAISDPRPSPDGKWVLFRVTESTVDGAGAHLWLSTVEQNTFRQITYSPAADKNGEADGQWMPDGKSILFVAKRGEHRQIFQLPIDGGEAHPFVIKAAPVVDASKLPNAVPPKTTPTTEIKSEEELELDVQSYTISPDGKTIAIVAGDPKTAGEKAQATQKADAEWVDHDMHGSRLYLFRPDTSKTTPIPVPAGVGRATWSNNSARLFVTQAPTDGTADLEYADKAWIVDASAAKAEKIEGFPRDVSLAEWSADDTAIWYIGQAHQDAPPGYGDLYQYNTQTKKVHNFTDGLSGTIGRGVIPLAGNAAVIGAGFGFDFAAIRVSEGSPTPERLAFQTPIITSLATNAKHSAWVYLGNSSTQPTTLYYTTALSQPARALSTPSLFASEIPRVQSKKIHWTSDRYTVEGVLYLPPEAAQHKVPLIVEVHGGPTGAYSDGYQPFVSFLLGHGWAVLRTNPRGSTSYGAAFAAANKNDLGGGDYRDIMAGVDYVLKTESIDPDQMALEGYSYGGEMAGFVECKTTRFKAIVSGAPVINQFSEFGTENGSFYDRWFYGKPYEHFEDVWRQSPLSGVTHAKTPFMLLQGQEDTTDPLGQSQEMYRALRQMGVPVELITYPRDDHGVLGGAIYASPSHEPWHGFDARQRIITFIQKAFGN